MEGTRTVEEIEEQLADYRALDSKIKARVDLFLGPDHEQGVLDELALARASRP